MLRPPASKNVLISGGDSFPPREAQLSALPRGKVRETEESVSILGIGVQDGQVQGQDPTPPFSTRPP